jgi:hypothetical protein
MRVQGFWIQRATAINQKGRYPGKMLRHTDYKGSALCSLEIGREFARESYQDSTVVFEVQHASDGLRQWSAKL